MLKTGGFAREERVRKSSDIRSLLKKGNRVSVPGAKLFFASNDVEINRIAFTLPHGYGNAVARNHSKRVSREAYRYFKAFLNIGYDMVLLVYPGNDSFRTRCAQFRCLCKKAGIISV